ncbi:MAG: glycosyltransferase family 2 protein [Candidatus Sericytochromatia bacterium]
MELSVIVIAGPERETNLSFCLEALTRQVFQNFEVIVADDGSEQGASVCDRFRDRLRIQHLHRPNDRCVARSNNLGSKAASTPNLVFLSEDILLNPFALMAYRSYLKRYPQCAVYGYMGYQAHHVAPSVWFPQQQVNYLDIRFARYRHAQVEAHPGVLERPHWYALGANFCLRREVLEAIGPFQEDYVYWGQEDLDLAYRLLQHGCQIHFSLDTWGEHQIHTRSSAFHDTTQRTAVLQMEDIMAQYAVKILKSTPIQDHLLEQIFTSYTQQDAHVSPETATQLRQPAAVLRVSNLDFENKVRKSHLRVSTTAG